MTKTYLEQVAERESEPDFLKNATERADAITDRLRKTNINALAQASQLFQKPSQKIYYMRRVLDTLALATAGIVPCKAGCSDCCHMATSITLREAQDIAKASGRTLTLPTDKKSDFDAVQAFSGLPCPMLKDNRCSVYAHRPFACRSHYSVDRDNLLCKIVPGKTIKAPSFKNEQFAMLNALTYKLEEYSTMADIREYFELESK
jgi:Fe-S-cluster containining protein